MIERRTFLLALCTACIGFDALAGEASPDDVAVVVGYLKYINRKAEDTETIIVESERTDASYWIYGFKSWQDIRRRLPKVSRAAAIDLLANSQQSSPLLLPLGALTQTLRVIQPSASEVERIFESDEQSSDEHWSNLRKQFDNASSIVRFSNVGYNASADEAIFIVGISCGLLCASSSLVLMRRSAKGWVRAKEVLLFIS